MVPMAGGTTTAGSASVAIGAAALQPSLGWRVHVALFALALLANLFCCFLSPLYRWDAFGSCDPNCFYMVGKAWMNGMLPYVDVVDVKGPLLFFLYALAYLFVPDGLQGAFPLYVLACYATLVAMAKTARLFRLTRFQSTAAAALCLMAIYWPAYTFHGAQSEQLTLVPLAWTLYGFVRLLYGDENRSALHAAGWVAGVSCASCILMKFNALAPCGTMVAASLYLLLRRRQAGAGGYMVRLLAGGCLVLLPFVLYLGITHSWDAFIGTYFVLNRETLSAMYSDSAYGSHIRFLLCGVMMLAGDSNQIPFACSVLAMLLPLFATGRGLGRWETRCLLLVVAAAFALCGVTGILVYYYIICSVLAIFPAIAVARVLPESPGRVAVCVTLLGIAMLAIRQNGSFLLRRTVFYPGDKNVIDEYINATPAPRLLYLGALDLGMGLRSGALPAIPQWCTLNGAPESFWQKQVEAVRQRKADFIIVREQYLEDDSFLHDYGYVPVVKGLERRGDILSLWQKKEHTSY